MSPFRLLVSISLLMIIWAGRGSAARLEITLVPFEGGLEAHVDADFDISTAALGLILDSPCTSCTWQRSQTGNPFGAEWGIPWVTHEGEDSFLVMVSTDVVADAPRRINPSSPRSFRLGQINFGGPAPEVLRPILTDDLAFDDLLDFTWGWVGGDAGAPSSAEGVIDFTEPGNVYSVRVIPEPGHLGVLGLLGMLGLRRFMRRSRC